MTEDSREYQQKKAFFDRVLTIYGRKPCLEAVSDPEVTVYRLHLSESNKPAPLLDQLISTARERGAEIVYHDKHALSRISKNAKQDQGVALDLLMNQFSDYQTVVDNGLASGDSLIALDRITNPQNLGMIIRSVCASPVAGLILPRKGCSKLDSLVIKASTGTLFRTPVVRCDSLATCLQAMKNTGALVVGLDARASLQAPDLPADRPLIFVLGNETEGLSPEVRNQCDEFISIPMRNRVESLNVAVTASLLAFRGCV